MSGLNNGKLKLHTSCTCPQCDHDYFRVFFEEVKETTSETLDIGVYCYANTRFFLTCCKCNNTFNIKYIIK